MPDMYSPQPPVAAAFSFEGIVNNGVIACGFEAFAAYGMFHPSSLERIGLKYTLDPGDFTDDARESDPYHAFVLLRPKVRKAGDYYAVVKLIIEHPDLIAPVLQQPAHKAAYEGALSRYQELWDATPEIRELYGNNTPPKPKGAFYLAREAIKLLYGEDKWNSLQSPYPDTLDELRQIAAMLEWDPQRAHWSRGIVPYFASSKDKITQWQMRTKSDNCNGSPKTLASVQSG